MSRVYEPTAPSEVVAFTIVIETICMSDTNPIALKRTGGASAGVEVEKTTRSGNGVSVSGAGATGAGAHSATSMISKERQGLFLPHSLQNPRLHNRQRARLFALPLHQEKPRCLLAHFFRTPFLVRE